MTNNITISINGETTIQVDKGNVVIKDGKIKTELEVWLVDVQENRVKTAENLKKAKEFTKEGWNMDDLNIEFNELHDECEELKQEAPDNWTINKEGYAVRR